MINKDIGPFGGTVDIRERATPQGPNDPLYPMSFRLLTESLNGIWNTIIFYPNNKPRQFRAV